jgi:hypothetical protein
MGKIRFLRYDKGRLLANYASFRTSNMKEKRHREGLKSDIYYKYTSLKHTIMFAGSDFR